MIILKYLKIGSFIGKTNLSVNVLLDFVEETLSPLSPVDVSFSYSNVDRRTFIGSSAPSFPCFIQKHWGLENIGREARGVEGNKNREQKASFGGKEYFPTETTVVYELRRP